MCREEGNQTKNSLPVGEVSHTLMHKCSYKKLFYLPCLENLAKWSAIKNSSRESFPSRSISAKFLWNKAIQDILSKHSLHVYCNHHYKIAFRCQSTSGLLSNYHFPLVKMSTLMLLFCLQHFTKNKIVTRLHVSMDGFHSTPSK